MTSHRKPGRLLGGLRRSWDRIASLARKHLTVADTVYAVLSALIGAAVGVAFAALWLR